jgi:hypothetical protein
MTGGAARSAAATGAVAGTTSAGLLQADGPREEARGPA